MKPRVYLAGPISGLDFDGATGWRTAAWVQLGARGIDAFSPMRAKHFLSGTGPIQPLFTTGNPLSLPKGIMCRDHTDCTRADALLVNFLGVDRVSLGTAMELAWAYDRHIPVVCVSEYANINICHPMAEQAIDFRVDTMAEGIALIETILLAGV